MKGESALEAALAPLYAAVLELERLTEFSAALCAATGSHIGAVMAHDVGCVAIFRHRKRVITITAFRATWKILSNGIS